jgi:hypothetical protein
MIEPMVFRLFEPEANYSNQEKVYSCWYTGDEKSNAEA